MTTDEYKEMLKDIIDNGAEYEYREYLGDEKWSCWFCYDIENGLDRNCEYRKKQHKTWLEENVGDNAPRLEAIKDFFEEFMRRAYNQAKEIDDGDDKPFTPDYIYYDDLVNIAKKMGVE